MGQKSGRKPTWTDDERSAWETLRSRRSFQGLEAAISKGVREAGAGDLGGLMLALGTPHVEEIRERIVEAAKTVTPPQDAVALLAALRATPEMARLSVGQAKRAARLILVGNIPVDPGTIDIDASFKTKIIPAMRALRPQDNSTFSRPPTNDRAPGQLYPLLRKLHRALDIAEPAADHGVVVEPLDPIVAKASRAAEVGSAPQLAAVAREIKARYKTDLELSQFASLVVEDHHVLERLVMSIALSAQDDRRFLFHVFREFQARLDQYVVCIARGDHVHGQIVRILPELRELIWLPEATESLDEAVAQLVRDGMLQIRNDRTAAGYESVSFDPVVDDDPMQLRLAAQGIDPSDYRLISYNARAADELRNYRSILPMTLMRNRRHCTWFADGPTYVTSIEVDVSALPEAANNLDMRVHYFLPGRNVIDGPPHFRRQVDSWVIRRHGFVIAW